MGFVFFYALLICAVLTWHQLRIFTLLDSKLIKKFSKRWAYCSGGPQRPGFLRNLCAHYLAHSAVLVVYSSNKIGSLEIAGRTLDNILFLLSWMIYLLGMAIGSFATNLLCSAVLQCF